MEASDQADGGGGAAKFNDDDIARRAYEISLRADGGTPEENWKRAREELENERR
jgi:hypothetical protein